MNLSGKSIVTPMGPARNSSRTNSIRKSLYDEEHTEHVNGEDTATQSNKLMGLLDSLFDFEEEQQEKDVAQESAIQDEPDMSSFKLFSSGLNRISLQLSDEPDKPLEREYEITPEQAKERQSKLTQVVLDASEILRQASIPCVNLPQHDKLYLVIPAKSLEKKKKNASKRQRYAKKKRLDRVEKKQREQYQKKNHRWQRM